MPTRPELVIQSLKGSHSEKGKGTKNSEILTLVWGTIVQVEHLRTPLHCSATRGGGALLSHFMPLAYNDNDTTMVRQCMHLDGTILLWPQYLSRLFTSHSLTDCFF